MTTYYISGPMRGKPNHNRDQFYEVEAELRRIIDWDSEIFNPARNFNGDQTLPSAVYMNLDLKQVLEADMLVLLPGWRESEGARREVQLGVWSGKGFIEAELRCAGGNDEIAWNFLSADISAPSEKPSPRADLLDEAKALITGDRNAAYGSPSQDFTRSADALNAYGYRGPDGRGLLPHDIAIFVMAVKLSRLMWSPNKRDSWVDIAGYAACGYECSTEEEAERLEAERLAV